MAIKSFIRLAHEFAKTYDQDNPNPFLSRRLDKMYWSLSVTDRLRIHNIIDRKDYINDPPKEYHRSQSPEETLQTLEVIYGLITDWSKASTLVELNKRPGQPQEKYEKIKVLGCIHAIIALDLAYALDKKPISADPSPSGPV